MTPPDHSPSDDAIRGILARVRTIAVVGLSANPDRPSHAVAAFLAARGYRVVGVNPGLAGQTMFGEPVCASLADIPFAIDMVDIFRPSDAVPPVVEAALALTPLPGVIWMQLGIRHALAAASARTAGVEVVENRCPRIEYARLMA